MGWLNRLLYGRLDPPRDYDRELQSDLHLAHIERKVEEIESNPELLDEIRQRFLRALRETLSDFR